MRFTFSNTVLGAGCGFRRRLKNLSCCTPPHAKASDISEPYDYATENSFTLAKRKNSMLKAVGNFGSNCTTKVFEALNEWSLFSTMRSTITRSCIRLGERRSGLGLRSTFFRLIVLDLNPIERVWKLTRRLCLHNVYFPKLDQVCISAERQFDQWSAGSNALKKLCAIT